MHNVVLYPKTWMYFSHIHVGPRCLKVGVATVLEMAVGIFGNATRTPDRKPSKCRSWKRVSACCCGAMTWSAWRCQAGASCGGDVEGQLRCHQLFIIWGFHTVKNEKTIFSLPTQVKLRGLDWTHTCLSHLPAVMYASSVAHLRWQS